MTQERIQTDVLVVGGGGAGMMAAIEAATQGARVCLVSKSRLLRGGATVMAPGAIAAVDEEWKDPEDSLQAHIEDTLNCAEGLADPFVVAQTVELAGEMIRRLEKMGAVFQRTPDGKKLARRITGGHQFPRSLYIENRVGREIAKALWSELQRLQVEILEEVVITDPLVLDGRIYGAAGFLLRDAKPIKFSASSVILATGGAGYLYALTDNPNDVTGDGFRFALLAGAQLTDMEFVQFYPMGFVYPPYARGQVAGFPAYARLYNAHNERFMARYDPRLELSTRDRLSIAIATEILQGRGSPHEGVFCSLEHIEAGRIEKELPGLYATYRAAGIDPYQDRFEVGPSAHFLQGGVLVDQNRMSRIEGLYAVGEAAAGMHGANRLGQNALTDILVSGFVAGRHAAERRIQMADCHDLETGTAVTCKKAAEIGSTRAVIRETMQRNVGVIRDRTGLEKALGSLRRIECADNWADWQQGTDRRFAFENACMALTGRCIAQSALMRTESIGCHYRSDGSPQEGSTGRQAHTVIEQWRDELRFSWNSGKD